MSPTKKKDLGIKVDRITINKILAVGHEFDLNKDGLFDARMGAVNIWCSPTDKPSCWNVEVTQGALDFPRAYVGGLYWEWTGDSQADLFIEVEAYDLVRNRGKLSDDEWDNVVEWVEQKVKGLLRLVELQADIVGTKCPFCDFVLDKGRLLNELIDHVSVHGEVEGIILGNPTSIVVERKSYPLEFAETFEE